MSDGRGDSGVDQSQIRTLSEGNVETDCDKNVWIFVTKYSTY